MCVLLYDISATGIYCTVFRLGVYIVRYFGQGYILYGISARGIYCSIFRLEVSILLARGIYFVGQGYIFCWLGVYILLARGIYSVGQGYLLFYCILEPSLHCGMFCCSLYYLYVTFYRLSMYTFKYYLNRNYNPYQTENCHKNVYMYIELSVHSRFLE